MKVEVRLFGPLREYLPQDAQGHRAFVELDDGSTVHSLLQRLGIPNTSYVVTVNDEAVDVLHQLQDGDVVSVFPPIAGG